jgi:hypothetical protein
MPYKNPAGLLGRSAIGRALGRAIAAALITASAANLLFFTTPAFAYSTSTTEPNEADLDNHGTYRNRPGETVHSPAHSKSGRIPEGATARCRDGTYSFSQHRRGTCSRHGGIAAWL